MRELNFGLDAVLKEADYKIKNNSTVDDLKKNIREVVLKVIQTY